MGSTTQIVHWINGQRQAGVGDGSQPVFNPAKGAAASTVALASPETVDLAVKGAAKAYKEWAATPSVKRARVMFKFKEWVESHRDDLAMAITSEHGKTLDDAKGEIQRGLEVVEFACGIPQLLKGEYTEQVGGGIDAWSVRQSLGVCVGISPFNFPVMVPMWMFPVAIAC
ncbi:MAG: aldehyde dehydrogenase family protein, partial [Burkholderiaceae bacterium]